VKKAVLVLGVALVVASGCQSKPAGDVYLRVLAAQSLSPSFVQLKAAFERKHARVNLDAAFGGSSLLATQLEQGAPGDVFIAADEATMATVAKAKLLDGRATLVAGNRLEIVVPAANPKHIAALADLNRPGTIVALCDTAVPCGRYAAQAFANAGVPVPNASRETNVGGVVTKVAAGEVDAGVVYVTDVKAAGNRVLGIAIPTSQNVVARYPAAVLKTSNHATEARAFVSFLQSAAGQRILRRFGFTAT
jgi:molybdate transport system substrate-binding protein